jgi:hypothetical protein
LHGTALLDSAAVGRDRITNYDRGQMETFRVSLAHELAALISTRVGRF